MLITYFFIIYYKHKNPYALNLTYTITHAHILTRKRYAAELDRIATFSDLHVDSAVMHGEMQRFRTEVGAEGCTKLSRD